MKVAALVVLLVSAPLLARAQTTVGSSGPANLRDPDIDRADVSIINTRNIPKPKLPTNAANSQTQPLVYSDPGAGLTYGGGEMSSTRSQTQLSGVSNVNVNKNKVWYSNSAGRPYPATRARTSLSGPLDFGNTRDSNFRGVVRSAGGQNDQVNSMGPVTISSTYYARSSAASGAWTYNSRRGRNNVAQTDPAYNQGGITNAARLINNSAVSAPGSVKRHSGSVSGNSNGFGVFTRTRKSSALAQAGGPAGMAGRR